MNAAARGEARPGHGDAVAAVLAGERSYDSVDDRSQALVRSAWRERIEDRLESLDLCAEFEAAAVPYAELDDDHVVVVQP